MYKPFYVHLTPYKIDTHRLSLSKLFKRDTRRFDWKICINGKYFYCEYFGMYFDTWKHDKSTKYKERTDKKYPT